MDCAKRVEKEFLLEMKTFFKLLFEIFNEILNSFRAFI